MQVAPKPPGLGALLSAEKGRTHILVCRNNGAAAGYMADALFFAPQLAQDVGLLPDWETLPYDQVPLDPTQVSRRIATLQRMAEGKVRCLFTSPAALLQRLPPPATVRLARLRLQAGQQMELDQLAAMLEAARYEKCRQVLNPGQYAVRGALVDFYPLAFQHPVRLDFLDDSLESIRTFDPDTQLSLERLDEVVFSESRELPLHKAALEVFSHNFTQRFDIDERTCPLYRRVMSGGLAPGAEYYTPLFFEETAGLHDYLGQDARLLFATGAAAAVRSFEKLVQARHEQLCNDPQRPLLQPQECFASLAEVLGRGTAPPPQPGEDAAGWRRLDPGDNPLEKALRAQGRGQRVAVVCGHKGRMEPVRRRLEELGGAPTEAASWDEFARSDAGLAVLPGDLGASYRNTALGLRVINSEEQGITRVRESGRPQQGHGTAAPEFLPGDLVVHPVHGVARFAGLEARQARGETQECAALHYAKGIVLYVSIESLHRLSRYEGEDSQGREPDQLGTRAFHRARAKAMEQARRDAAVQLEQLAMRAKTVAPSIECDPADMEAFAKTFAFAATEGQERVLAEILADMRGPAPMDRLLCGDVGFGKTEVAVRAIYAAVKAGYQACLIVPTTLLCHQHTQTLRDRFTGWGVRVESLSSIFQQDKERVRRELAEGKVDVLISTHALMRGRYEVPRLGLAVIDEEHRFGVSDKDAVLRMSRGAHRLKMSATPIPRSLAKALAGISEISRLDTPLPGRIPIATQVKAWDDALVREAIQRELQRGGQVFVVHYRIAGLQDYLERLRDLVPRARYGIAHGGMHQRRLRSVVEAFRNRQIDVLLSTTIVESGLDLANANTILITRADRMGIATLHQLRGRVGRGSSQAWCWLLHPPIGQLPTAARARLAAVSQAATLGSGTSLAEDDLEIRGAGELLGTRQHGHIQKVGLRMYLDLLHDAIEEIQSGKPAGDDEEGEDGPMAADLTYHLGDSALLPEDYIDDPFQRLLLYRRLARAEAGGEIEEVREEMADRFGPLPEEAEALVRNCLLRLRGQRLGIRSVNFHSGAIHLDLEPEPGMDPMRLVQLVRKHPEKLRVRPDKLRVTSAAGSAARDLDWFFSSLE